MTLVSDAPEACRSALGVEVRPVARAALGNAERWAADEFLAGANGAAAGVWGSTEGSSIAPTWPGPIVVAERAAESQFVRLQRRLGEGVRPPDGLACVALTGSRFQGQRGRAWATLPGNLHVSVHLTFDGSADDAAGAQAAISVLPAVAASRAIERASEGSVRPRLKWVNDLLLDDRKVGGVLSATRLEAGRVRHLLFGIGLNVAAVPRLPLSERTLPPARVADRDASFAHPDAWGRLLAPLLEALVAGRDRLRQGRGDELIDAYRERAAFLGRTVTIWPIDESSRAGATSPAHANGSPDIRPLAHGRVEALLPDLSLRIAGHDTPIRQGRMTIDAKREV